MELSSETTGLGGMEVKRRREDESLRGKRNMAEGCDKMASDVNTIAQ